MLHVGVSKKWAYPKMDGEKNGKPYFLMDDLGGFNPTIFFWNTHVGGYLPTFPLEFAHVSTKSIDPGSR